MSPLRILIAATAIEMCLLSAVVALIGAVGAVNGWLDLMNCISPLLAPVGAGGAIIAFAGLQKSRLRKTCIVLGGAAALYGGFMLISGTGGSWPGPAAGAAAYRIVSANLFRDNVSPRAAALAVTAEAADALLLQETDSVVYTPRSSRVLQSRYPYASNCPAATVQIRVKVPLLAQGCGLDVREGGSSASKAAFVWVRVKGPEGRPMVLATVHLKRPYPPEEQALQRQILARAMQQTPRGDPVILAGDFNTAPWTFGMRSQDRSLRPLRRWTGLLPSYPAQINLILKPWSLPLLPIDHLYASSAWTPVRVALIRTPGSDHFALEADLALRP